MMRRLLTRLIRSAEGSSAIEFALVLPVTITLMVGSVCAANLFFAANSLHFAVQDAARCAAVKTTVCTSSASTIAYAEDTYSGPRISPSFAYSEAGCGHTVSGTATYPIYYAFGSVKVPISASACYP
jgi:Flp pilus assembly protein TadG